MNANTAAAMKAFPGSRITNMHLKPKADPLEPLRLLWKALDEEWCAVATLKHAGDPNSVVGIEAQLLLEARDMVGRIAKARRIRLAGK